MSINLLRDHNVLDRVLLPINFYSSIVLVQQMHCTRLACINHSYSIRDLICLTQRLFWPCVLINFWYLLMLSWRSASGSNMVIPILWLDEWATSLLSWMQSGNLGSWNPVISPASLLGILVVLYRFWCKKHVLEWSWQAYQCCSACDIGDLGWCHGTVSSGSLELNFQKEISYID